MKSKIIGFSIWSVTFGSILYSYLSGDENYAGVGVALVWIGVIIVATAVLLSAVVFCSGTEEQKKKTMEAYLDGGAFARFIGWLKTCSMFILLCISSYWFTGVVYLLIAIIMACIGYCVRESEKNAANFTA